MKKLGKKCVVAVLVLTVLLANVFTVSAAVSTQSSSDTWTSFGITFAKITLSAEGNYATGEIYDVWFSKATAYYPFYLSDKTTWDYQIGSTGYAKGQYTLHGSLGYKITSDIRTETETIILVF